MASPCNEYQPIRPHHSAGSAGRSARVSAAVALALAATACSSRPEAVLEAVSARAPGATEVEMLVTTTRRPDKPGVIFSGERGTALAFAELAISIPPDAARTIGEVQWPTRHPGNPEKEFVATKVDVLDLAGARRRFGELLAKPRNSGRALVFVHGYNTRFDDAVMRFAQIMHDSKAPGVPVLFTWPSRGSVLAYPYDRESGNYSRDALEAVLTTLSQDKRIKEISILAHSMGNWVTMEALRTMALKHGRVNPKITGVMLAAPDVDVDVFHTQLRAFGTSPPRMTLFVSRDDRALNASRHFWGDVPRLGAIDPTEEPYRKDIERANIAVVDLTKVKGEDFMNHGKFAESPEIVRLIGHRLSQGQSLQDGQESLGDNLVSAATAVGAGFGTITGRLITAPVQFPAAPR